MIAAYLIAGHLYFVQFTNVKILDRYFTVAQPAAANHNEGIIE